MSIIYPNEETLMDELHSIADECPVHTLGASLLQAKETICGERQDSYGNPENSFNIIAQYWSIYIANRSAGHKSSITPLDVANMMVLFKQARKLGQIHCRDNYIDSIGYEAIAADRLSD